MESREQLKLDQKERVCIIGNGNFATAIARIVGSNCLTLPNCEDRVSMWVFEEIVEIEGKYEKLSESINTQHENVKYLPGHKLPGNVVAVPDLMKACMGATLLIFVLPHQYLPRLLPTIRDAVHSNCRGISLVKGLGEFGRNYERF